MKVIIKPTRPRIRARYVVLASVALAIGILWAQQPVSQGPQASNAAAWQVNMNQIGGATLALGQTTMSASIPVAIASNQSAVAVSFGPSSVSGGALSRFHAATGAAANVKASGGNLYGLVVGNSGTIPCWLQVMNTASTPTAGTSVLDSYMIQAGTTFILEPGGLGLTNYSSGIGIAAATADAGATTTGCTTTLSVTVYYQ